MNCPHCQSPAKHMDTQTIKGLLSASLEILAPGNPYHYCKSADCPVVYFHEDGEQVITEDDIRVPVYHKRHNEPDTPICYCFGIDTSQLLTDIEAQNGEESVARINAGIKAGQCACDIRNPEGSCCLGNVKQHIKMTAVSAA